MPGLKYSELEAQAGDHTRSNAVYWRAVRTLDDPQDFISQHQLNQVNPTGGR